MPTTAGIHVSTVAALKVVGGGMRRHDMGGKPVRQWLARLV